MCGCLFAFNAEFCILKVRTQKNKIMSAQTSPNRSGSHEDREKMSTMQLYAQIALVIVIIGGIATFAYFVV